MIVNCAHPVPVRYVPFRGRTERVAYVRRTTPVELRTLAAREFERFEYLPGGSLLGKSMGGDRTTALFIRGGRLWHRMVVFNGAPHGPTYRSLMPADRFIQILEGEDPEHDDFGKHFAQTPLAAIVRRAGAWRGRDMDILTRGEPDPDGMARGRVVADMNEPAVAALHDLFANEIAVVEGHVLVRVAGPLFVHDINSPTARLRVTLFPRMFSSSGTPYPVNREGPDFRHVAPYYNEPARKPADPGAVDLPPGLAGDDDIEIFVLETVRTVAHELESLIFICPGEPWTRDPAVVALADRLATEAALSRIGALPPMPLSARLEGLLADIETVSGLHREAPYPLTKAAGYITDYALPRLGAVAGVSPEDEEAMGGLTP